MFCKAYNMEVPLSQAQCRPVGQKDAVGQGDGGEVQKNGPM